MDNRLRKLALPAALAAAVGAGATILDAARDPIPELGAQAPAPAIASADNLATAFRGASKAAMPAVVYVQVEAAPQTVSRQVPEGFRGTPFEEFFGGPGGKSARPRQGSGSGFIISRDGYVLTNNHVVEDASRVTVVLTDKREFDAKVVGRDPNTDIAVLKIDGENLPTAVLGDADQLQVGDWVLALGYPMSLGETVTAGIVSAKGKSINILRTNREAQAPLEHFIQTDAAINPGNSGGPLLDLRGRVIGINTAIASPTGTYSGYGFAVPVNLAKRVADDLIRYGAVHRPKLGIQINDVTPADVEVFRLSDARGSVVRAVPAGPARDAGVELGDVILAVDGQPVEDTGDLMERIARRQPGETVRLDVVRYGKQKQLSVRLGAFESEKAPRPATDAAEPADDVGRLGFAATQLTPALAAQLDLDAAAQGVVVTRVDPMGPAAQYLRPGFRIERLNGREIRSVPDLRAAAGGLRAGETVSVIGRDRDGTQTIVNFRTRR